MGMHYQLPGYHAAPPPKKPDPTKSELLPKYYWPSEPVNETTADEACTDSDNDSHGTLPRDQQDGVPPGSLPLKSVMKLEEEVLRSKRMSSSSRKSKKGCSPNQEGNSASEHEEDPKAPEYEAIRPKSTENSLLGPASYNSRGSRKPRTARIFNAVRIMAMILWIVITFVVALFGVFSQFGVDFHSPENITLLFASSGMLTFIVIAYCSALEKRKSSTK